MFAHSNVAISFLSEWVVQHFPLNSLTLLYTFNMGIFVLCRVLIFVCRVLHSARNIWNSVLCLSHAWLPTYKSTLLNSFVAQQLRNVNTNTQKVNLGMWFVWHCWLCELAVVHAILLCIFIAFGFSHFFGH